MDRAAAAKSKMLGADAKLTVGDIVCCEVTITVQGTVSADLGIMYAFQPPFTHGRAGDALVEPQERGSGVRNRPQQGLSEKI